MLRSGDEEGTSLMHRVQPREVQIAPIQMKEDPGFEGKNIEHIDIAQIAVADVNEAGNGATQIEQRVQLDRRLGRASRQHVRATAHWLTLAKHWRRNSSTSARGEAEPRALTNTATLANEKR